jgi:hypothetical protein
LGANAEPKTGSSILFAQAKVALHEWFKYAVLKVLGDSRASIFYLDLKE